MTPRSRYRSHGPPWECSKGRSRVPNRDAGASLAAFPRWSMGTINCFCFGCLGQIPPAPLCKGGRRSPGCRLSLIGSAFNPRRPKEFTHAAEREAFARVQQHGWNVASMLFSTGLLYTASSSLVKAEFFFRHADKDVLRLSVMLEDYLVSFPPYA